MLWTFRFVFGLSLLLLGCATNPKKPHGGKSLIQKIDAVLESRDFNGVVLISQNDSTIYIRAKGYSDLEHKTLLKASDLFIIGSISKQITAVLVLKEVEKGYLNLNGPIVKYLPQLKESWAKEVTIHHLLTHTHGIIDLDRALAFELGSKFQYSQLGYELLANILEKILGMSFEEISTNFFRENGLSHTFHPKDSTYTNLVKGYINDANGSMSYERGSLDNYVPAGSFISNAEDLQKWNQLLYNKRLVKEETLAMMKTRYATRIHPVFGEVEYGYGLLFKLGEENVQVGAFGYAPAFVSANYYYPANKMTVIVLENVARNLEDFRKTFAVHSAIMEIAKQAAE